MVKRLVLSLALPCLAAAACLPLFGNEAEIAVLRKRQGDVIRWNAVTEEFDRFETLTSNRSVFCSVNMAMDLQGKTLEVAVVPLHPYIMGNAGNTSNNAQMTEITGFIGDIWTTLEEVLKFKTIYRRATWRYEQTLTNENTHALLIVVAMYSHTSSYYTYSVPFTTGSYALFLQSEGETISGKWYIRTFSRGLWLMSFAFVVCIACSIAGVYHVKKLTAVNYKECDDELSSLSFNLLYALGGISGQGFPKIPRSWPLRLIILSCLLMGMFLSCGFSSTLISALANRGNSVSLDNLEDLAVKHTHSLCIRNDSSAYVHFTTDNTVDGDIKDKWKRLVNNGCPDIRDSAILSSHLCQPGFAYLEAPSIFLPIYHEVRRNCSIIQLPKMYWQRRLAFLHTRSSRYRHLIDIYLMRMRSAGILNYLEKKWISMDIYSQSNHLHWSTFQPVNYEHIHLAFFEFTVMVTISIIICILENIWYRVQVNFRKTNSNSILLGMRDDYVMNNATKACRKAGPRLFARRRKISSILSPANIKRPAFRQSVTVRMNHW